MLLGENGHRTWTATGVKGGKKSVKGGKKTVKGDTGAEQDSASRPR